MLKRTGFKRSSKTTRQKLIKANDDLFRKIIHLRDKVCQLTRRSENLQVVHYWTRSILRVRWDLDNACLLNGAKHIFWAHVRPDQFREFWIRRLGQQKFMELEIRARYIAPMKEFDLICTNQRLKKQLKEYTTKW